MPRDNDRDLAEAINALAESIKDFSCEKKTEFEWLRSHLLLATKQDLDRMECRIMSRIGDHADRVNTKLGSLETSIEGIVVDVKFLKDKITELQSNPGPITPADQAILDALEARVTSLSDKVGALDTETDSSTSPQPPQPSPVDGNVNR